MSPIGNLRSSKSLISRERARKLARENSVHLFNGGTIFLFRHKVNVWALSCLVIEFTYSLYLRTPFLSLVAA